MLCQLAPCSPRTRISLGIYSCKPIIARRRHIINAFQCGLIGCNTPPIRQNRNPLIFTREEDRPGKTIFVITTDGMENASRRYTYQQVQKMVKHQQGKYGWEFLFPGANMDAISVARSFGIREDRAVRYSCDEVGTGLNFAVVSEIIGKVRRGQMIDSDWSAEIAEDFAKRGK